MTLLRQGRCFVARGELGELRFGDGLYVEALTVIGSRLLWSVRSFSGERTQFYGGLERFQDAHAQPTALGWTLTTAGTPLELIEVFL